MRYVSMSIETVLDSATNAASGSIALGQKVRQHRRIVEMTETLKT